MRDLMDGRFSGTRRVRAGVIFAVLVMAFGAVRAEAKVTGPKEQFGFDIGDDYKLVNYTQLLAYWKKIDAESDRMTLVEIGRTAEGRPMVMAVITSPRNQARLGRYKEISRRLALAKGLDDAQARRLAAAGKAVVWIDGGLHATEILGSQQLIELVYRMTSRDDAETRRLLDDVILLAVPSNPDGLELVANWYMREPDPLKRTMSGLPVLYQKYIGHDDNRDSYMVTQPETEAQNRVLYRDWHPQIVYNHHQTGPAGTVLFAPPFRDPFNYVFDPLIPVGIDLVAAAMHNRFVAEGKPGAIMRSGASYSTWWNGGLRSTGYFHNIIGILTEAIGSPTPIDIPFIPQRLLPKEDYPFPVTPQKWHFRQSVEYAVTADLAILDVASKNREDFLFRRYLMGKHAIEKGSRDTWTVVPDMVAALEAAAAKDSGKEAAPAPPGPDGEFERVRGVPLKYYDLLFDKSARDPRGYVIPSDQPDFLTATKFVNALIKNGCEVLRATKEFAVGARTYAKGSYVVKTAQAFRPHILTMFEPQDHPNDLAYPGGPPVAPYDSAGWTLAYQMGVAFDRILDGFDGPFETIPDVLRPPAGSFETRPGAAGYVLDHRVNDTFIAVNRILKAGGEAYWLKGEAPAEGKSLAAGTIYVPANPDLVPVVERAAREVGLTIGSVASAPKGEAYKLRPPRIGLWDTYGGSMASGWIRWLFEQFEFPYDLVFAPALDEGNLKARFDVLVFVGGSMPRLTTAETGAGGFRDFQPAAPANVPAEYHNRVGRITVEKTIPRLREFLEAGGTILALDTATLLAYHLDLPVANALVEKTADGKEKPLGMDKYFVPGSLLRAAVDTTHPLACGLPGAVDVFVDNTPAFTLLPDAEIRGVRPVVWFGTGKLLRSGWAWGEQYLWRSVQVAEAAVGQGKLFLYGPEIAFRGQPHGTFKLLFNGLYYGSAETVELK
ncbi:MAG TPA: M14 metallopeptidase family protein [Terriglobales bacterium]|nr:M14 metallopeptidase family protein [Terriglobales bacterium]